VPLGEKGPCVSDVTRYRWSRAYGLRFAGIAISCLAVLWVVVALAGFAWWGWLLLTIGMALLAGCLVRFVWLPPVLLEVSSHGYRLLKVRGGGVPTASWADVESVATSRRESGSVMVVTLSDGRTTSVPLVLLGSQTVAAEREMHSRLNSAFGYRRLRDS
jgi:hypothetical protein